MYVKLSCKVLFCSNIVTIRNSIRGEVMFLHLSVSHSVHRGVGGCLWQKPPQADTSWADTFLGRIPQQTPPETATAADGTHHTGMYSC